MKNTWSGMQYFILNTESMEKVPPIYPFLLCAAFSKNATTAVILVYLY
jgi:hypothetical protein